MSKMSRSSIVGFHNIKNKVSRNAFDLSHRHMFTAQIGELLPVFVQWVNPNETFKLGYNGFSRTQPLQTAAFTRLKENIQYYFVPFQSLWKYFEQQVNNMTVGQSGENISRIAKSASEDTAITTSMPYINYDWFATAFEQLIRPLAVKMIDVWNENYHETTLSDLLAVADLEFGNYRYARVAKLLRALGYINTDLDNYDIASNIIAYGQTLTDGQSMNVTSFLNSSYGVTFFANIYFVENSPNLSIFPLLAYQKIVNDHYLYRQWQPYKSYACNIDYLQPQDSMNFAARLPNLMDAEMFTLGQSNLPLDYFNGVLPKAQYGDESVASLDVSIGNLTGNTTSASYDSVATPVLAKKSSMQTPTDGVANVRDGKIYSSGDVNFDLSFQPPHKHEVNLSGEVTSSYLKVSALRSAIALQKYKEIQESNDSDFASQVLAHFGVKPRHDDYKSVFIGGGDSVLDINPQVNQNLTGDNTADIKATAAGQLSCGCKFTSDTYGIIIGIYRCVPQLDLAHVGIDRNLFKTDASDFPIPELDNIGMQTQYRSELVAPRMGSRNSAGGPTNEAFTLDMSLTYGYLPRYAELKTSYDRFEGAFLDSLSSWVTGYDASALTAWLRPYNQTVSPQFYGIDKLLKCSPELTYPIFVDQTSLTCNSDKILVGSVNTCIAVRPFSVYGLPYSK